MNVSYFKNKRACCSTFVKGRSEPGSRGVRKRKREKKKRKKCISHRREHFQKKTVSYCVVHLLFFPQGGLSSKKIFVGFKERAFFEEHDCVCGGVER